ncbi:hypothetical protein [Bradyrhizobium sp. AUGA SZCCT0283]|uniref:hypothetical protein n=1 Tax=Bradyrhizobium sp. AUGA SZCCT0283 TaxID=2807671 RepID=UPI001BA58F77|nr:hypothetical protein [Bradyrhizobium sp. AUGA SZCCT0283]MBR1277459.1 hypothetical protein [Bradyrhizobium sp. AUGA SZCCT0283]
MTQADSVHSTPHTSTPISQTHPVDAPTRRRFLSQAAGGAVLSLAAVSATEAGAAPAGSLDPVFGLIEAHRRASESFMAANAEMYRLDKLADDTVGPVGCSVFDFRHRPGFCPVVWATTLGDIGLYAPPDRFPEMHKFYIGQLRERDADRMKVTGNHDALLKGPLDAEIHALEALINVVPTSLAGITAWVSYLNNAVDELGERRLDLEYVLALLASLEKALNGITTA